MKSKSFVSMPVRSLFTALLTALAGSLAASVASANTTQCPLVFGGGLAGAPAKLNPELERYESAHGLSLPIKGKAVEREHGWKVTARDSQGRATKARLDLLVDNAGYDGQIFVVGPFNGWGKNIRPGDALHPVAGKSHMFSGEIEGIVHGMQYRILLNGKQVLDPTALMYTTKEYLARTGQLKDGAYINSVFYDMHDSRLYQTQTDFVDISTKPALIGEVELHSLVAKFADSTGQTGPRTTAETFKFIAQSGVIAKMKEAGYTAVEMLPFNQSVDGDSWHFRYQVFGLFAPDSRYGNPSEFKMMIDEFHRNGIAVVMDSVISHFPFKGNQNERGLQGVGMDQWYRADGKQLFVGPMSPWETYRYDYSNPHVRRMLIDSVVFMMNEYKIDGIRMDNTDGILGTNGGPELLKELVLAAREANPRALIIGEAFFPPNSLLQRTDQGGFGFNTRNDSNFFEIWKEGLGGPTESLNVTAIGKLLRNIFDWGEAPMMRYLTNHDESANGRGGFTGGYPASLIQGDEYYAFGKTKAADGLNMLVGSYHVSLPQARMMQKGTFYSNPEVDWNMVNSGRGKNLWDYFGALSRYMQAQSGFFGFGSLSRDIENHVDDTNKIISLKRRDPATGKNLYILVNLGHHNIENYAFGTDRQARYRVGFDSEWSGFGGQEGLKNAVDRSGQNGLIIASTRGEHGKPASINVPVVAPYSVTIFEEQ